MRKFKNILYKFLTILLMAALALPIQQMQPQSISAAETKAASISIPIQKEEALAQMAPEYKLAEIDNYDTGSKGFSLPTEGTCGADGDNIRWKLEDGVFTLTGSGKMKDYTVQPWILCRNQITTVNISEGITYLGQASFYGCSSLSRVSLPSTLTGIGKGVFTGCSELTAVTLPGKLTSIGEFAFQKSGIVTINLPSSLKEIGQYAFSYCTDLQKIAVPSSIKEIPAGAFCQCTSLKSVTLKKGLKTIGEYAFYGCSALKKVTLPSGISEVAANAFSQDTTVSNLPDAYTQMEDGSICTIAKVKINVKEQYKEAFSVLTIVNKERKKQGLNTLKMDKKLLAAAMLRAAELSVYYSHTRPSGLDCFTAAPNQMSGENIAAGYTSASAVMQGWMNSPGHRANILYETYKSIGIGCIEIDGKKYWAQCFGCEVLKQVKAGAYKDKSRSRTISASTQKPYYSPMISFSSAQTGKGGTITISVRWDNGFTTIPIPAGSLKYKSAKKAVCTVSKGKITGKSPGTAKVQVWFPGYKKGKTTKKIKIS